eukprot:m.167250 g.167250  ORF g.167250 m.167250 type:complete len:343 (+) comp18190_c0_seq1:324-1352(+)
MYSPKLFAKRPLQRFGDDSNTKVVFTASSTPSPHVNTSGGDTALETPTPPCESQACISRNTMSPVLVDENVQCSIASHVVTAFVLVMVPVHLAEAVCDAANSVGLIPIEVATTEEAITAVDNAGPENVVAAVVDVGADDTSDSVWPLLCALDQRGMEQVFVAVLSEHVYGNSQTETECFASGVQMVSDSIHDVAQALSLVSLDVRMQHERARSHGMYQKQPDYLLTLQSSRDNNSARQQSPMTLKQTTPRDDHQSCGVCKLQMLTEAVWHLELQQSSLSVARPGELQYHQCTGCTHSQTRHGVTIPKPSKFYRTGRSDDKSHSSWMYPPRIESSVATFVPAP